MGRKIYKPKSNAQDRIYPTPKPTEIFQYGTLKDPPATTIPQGALSDAFNVKVFPKEVQGREGSELYTLAPIPAIPDRSGFSASQSGKILTATVEIFTMADVANFWVWPDGTHDQITQYISETQVKLYHSATRPIEMGCYIRGKNNFFRFHRQQKKWIYQFYKYYYHAEIGMETISEVLTISRDLPSNAKSDYKDFDDFSAVSFNSNGIFKIDFEINPALAYKINTPVPDTAIVPQFENDDTDYAYRYLYSAARLAGSEIFRNRLGSIRIESETGTNTEDKETNEAGKDKVWTEEPIDEENPNIIGPLYVPKVTNTDEYQWHFTHFPIYRTGDIEGWKAINETDYRGKINNPERFIWCYDLRICGAFYAIVENGVVTAIRGEFELADVGSVLEWDDGTRDEILEFVSSSKVRIAGNEHYGGNSLLPRACEIGNGRVMRASQTGDIITRTHGASFDDDDLRKTLHWAEGGRSYVIEIIDSNTVRAHESFDREIQGLTLDPIYRYYNDVVTDDQLGARETSLLLRQRFWTPMPNCNIGVLPPGFMVVAQRNSNEVYYCQLALGYEFLAGFYNAAIQLTKVIKEDIQMLWVFPDKIVEWTSGKTYHTPTNQPGTVILPKTGDVIATLPGTEILDPDKGLFNWGSIQNIGNGKIRMWTSEPGFVGDREFNGTSYSENKAYDNNFAMGRMSKDINNMWPAVCSNYNGVTGYVVWGKEKTDG